MHLPSYTASRSKTISANSKLIHHWSSLWRCFNFLDSAQWRCRPLSILTGYIPAAANIDDPSCKVSEAVKGRLSYWLSHDDYSSTPQRWLTPMLSSVIIQSQTGRPLRGQALGYCRYYGQSRSFWNQSADVRCRSKRIARYTRTHKEHVLSKEGSLRILDLSSSINSCPMMHASWKLCS